MEHSHTPIVILSGYQMSEDQKRCSKCTQEKPYSQFQRNRAMKDGFHNQCRECHNESTRSEYRKLVIEHLPPAGSDKVCKKCKLLKTADSFQLSAGKRDGLGSWCRECTNARNRTREYTVKPPDPSITEKYCKTCDTTKAISEFRYDLRKGSYACYCKKCHNKKNRMNELKKKYGLSVDDVLRMQQEQQGKCAICKESHRLVIDHDHATGAVRGLLCHACNTSIGHMKDDTRILQSAIEYLNRSASTGCLTSS